MVEPTRGILRRYLLATAAGGLFLFVCMATVLPARRTNSRQARGDKPLIYTADDRPSAADDQPSAVADRPPVADRPFVAADWADVVADGILINFTRARDGNGSFPVAVQRRNDDDRRSSIESKLHGDPGSNPASEKSSEVKRRRVTKLRDTYYVNEATREYDCAADTRRRLPDCVIIGFRKCGTMALLRMLGQHPGIAVRDWSPVEVNFFNRHYDRGVGWYRESMPCSSSDQITIEKSPRYVIDVATPERMSAVNRRMKLIVVLREPVARTVSDYLEHNDRSVAFESLTYDADVGRVRLTAGVNESVYHAHVARWLRHFPRRQFLFVDGDALVRQPATQLRRVEEFLGVTQGEAQRRLVYNKEKGFFCFKVNEAVKVKVKDGDRSIDQECLGGKKGRKHPDVAPEVTHSLRRMFAPHNEIMFEMIGRRFDWNR
ncbi:PREDICTED: heparan sulfate glucosamine 3-O-sulfotransferase 1-like [Priapulus caudatus]|uniref:Heparan sulfate glucosamine 3-O-sulfotransferase 1-like n=1 Tax=Priapulus caudatus TaxID=37621 RepID=A0ABM1F156_PRICU|nr:PREDICTED: heparan sulfate glucosamine 3-O-sulfotransferase 1-like [Priapulus caudatus]XP_014678178.1 PREDICTED: heparan sulfate glucosamine 3-O-sulfotransferase 1-like [Priapulus caudatus]